MTITKTMEMYVTTEHLEHVYQVVQTSKTSGNVALLGTFEWSADAHEVADVMRTTVENSEIIVQVVPVFRNAREWSEVYANKLLTRVANPPEPDRAA